MEYALCQSIETSKQNECVVVGLCSDVSVSEQLKSHSSELIRLVEALAQQLTEKGDWLWQTQIKSASLLLYHCGKHNEFDANAFLKSIKDIMPLVIKQKVSLMRMALPYVVEHSSEWQMKQLVLNVDAHCYVYNDFKTKKKTIALKKVFFYQPDTDKQALDKEALDWACATAQGVSYTRWLADLPANYCTPTFLAQQAKELAKTYASIKVKVLSHPDMQKLGMGGILAVSQGSIEPPKFIELSYQGKSKHPPIVLVGKGITFDAGGISLKPALCMEEMKYDMSGAAAVLGTLKICALLKLPIHVIGLIPSTENLPSGSAIKPGDVITSLSGQTIEVVNTDAEGRLILADALTYAERFNPAFVLDLATLTGAIIISLGYINTGFMTADDQLAGLIAKAAAESHDKAWRLPLDDAYQEALESPVADMLNSTFDRSAGSITGACFLARFTKKYRWAHLDIAGSAWVSGKERHATGRPVPLLVELLRHVIHSR